MYKPGVGLNLLLTRNKDTFFYNFSDLTTCWDLSDYTMLETDENLGCGQNEDEKYCGSEGSS